MARFVRAIKVDHWTYRRVQISCEAYSSLSLSRTRERPVSWPWISLSSDFSLEYPVCHSSILSGERLLNLSLARLLTTWFFQPMNSRGLKKRNSVQL